MTEQRSSNHAARLAGSRAPRLSRDVRGAHRARPARRLRWALAGTALAGAVLFPAVVPAAPLDLTPTPLSVGSLADPNVFLALDDSGSMGWDFLFADLRHPTSAYQDLGEDYCPGACPSVDWRSFAPAEVGVVGYNTIDNTLAFVGDPDARAYEPWWDTPYGDSEFDNARTWPDDNNPNEFEGTDDLEGAEYIEWVDDAGSASDPPNGPGDYVAGGDGVIDAWDTYRVFTINDSDIDMMEVSFSPTSGDAGATTTTRTLTGGEPELHGQTVAEVQQRYANWYTYHRTRGHVLAAAMGDLLQAFPNMRFGTNTIWDRFFVEMPAAADSAPYTTHNQDMFETFRRNYRSSGGTPLRNAVDRAGRYYEGSLGGRSSPINEQCQQNFTLAMTDGFWNRNHGGTGDVDGDGVSNLLADIARHYYETDLSGLPDNVPSTIPDPLTDNFQDQQHMVSYGVAFGVTGHLEDTNDDGWPDNDTTGALSPPFEVDTAWTNGSPSGDATLDDLWHMAFNSTGEFLSAQDPADLTQSLQDALGSIAARTGSAAAVAANTAEVTSDTLLYQARFNSDDWSGNVVAFDILPDGTVDLGSPVWEAADNIPAPGTRTVFTIDPDEGGEPGDNPGKRVEDTGGSTLDGLTGDQSAALNDDIDLQRYLLLGDPSGEERNGGGFRDRPSTVLGDIVNSAPEVTRGGNFGYSILPGQEGDDYPKFLAAKQGWSEMLYVGANDGMLHAIDARQSGGGEEFAFVPDAVYDELADLADPNYNHRFFVDGQVRVADAHYAGGWSSILAGSTGLGARAVFALDVSGPPPPPGPPAPPPPPAPPAFGSGDVLWELSGDDHSGLGHVLGDLHVVRMNNGEWAVVFGNGYNSDDETAQLFIVPLEDPDSPIVIDTGVNTGTDANGLGGVTPADIDADGTADVVYGGDLEGNLWRFDLSSSNDSQWDDAGNRSVLFEAEDDSGDAQPITAAPAIARHSDPGVDINVLFGTGRGFVQGDESAGPSPQIQSFYGIQDDGSGGTVARGNLLEQEIINQATGSNGQPFREISTNNRTSEPGWFIDLVVAGGTADGERVVDRATVIDERVFFLSQVPNDQPCAFGGTSWLYELDAEAGQNASLGTFDDVDTDAGAVGFDQLASGLTGLAGDGKVTLYPSMGDATIEDIETSARGAIRGRQSWRELR